MVEENIQQRVRPFTRRGMATLEFVMALPILLVLMVGITWLGFSVIGQTETLVEARNKAWKRRFEDKAKNPLVFPAGLLVATNPFYSHDDDYVSETVTKPVDVSPVFSAMPSPQAKHTILAGSWDHKAIDLNNRPDLELYVRVAANAVTGDIQTQLGNLSQLIDSVQQSGVAAIAQAFTQATDLKNQGSNSESVGASGDSATKEKERQDKQALQEQQSELGGVINPLNNQVMPVDGGQLEQTIEETNQLERELFQKQQATPETDEAKERERLAELARLERRIRLLKNKRQRIESEVRDITDELNAYQD